MQARPGSREVFSIWLLDKLCETPLEAYFIQNLGSTKPIQVDLAAPMKDTKNYRSTSGDYTVTLSLTFKPVLTGNPSLFLWLHRSSTTDIQSPTKGGKIYSNLSEHSGTKKLPARTDAQTAVRLE